MNRIASMVFAMAIMLMAASCRNEDSVSSKKIFFIGEAQGTYYTVTYFAVDTIIHQFQIDSMLNAFDQSASTWVENSVISRVNNNDPEVIPDKDFIEIFKLSKRIWQSTDGAFDITVGPLVNAWGFGFKNKMTVTKQVVDSLLQLVNFQGIYLKDGKIIKEDPHIQIDYNAIAQGYSVDLVGGFLQSKGIENYLIDIGGEVLAKGTKNAGEQWVVGIEKPAEEANSEREIKATIKLLNKAIATSGNYRKFYVENGIRYSHTIDPKTGYPARHSLLSATVMTDSAAIADGYATALMVMGLEKSVDFLKKNPQLDAYLIYSLDDGSYKTWGTNRFLEMVDELE